MSAGADGAAPTFGALARLTEAEEWFEALGVPFDPAALATVRLAVLRRFGLELQAIAAAPGQADAARLDAARGALATAYATALARQRRGAVYRGPLVQLRRPAS